MNISADEIIKKLAQALLDNRLVCGDASGECFICEEFNGGHKKDCPILLAEKVFKASPLNKTVNKRDQLLLDAKLPIEAWGETLGLKQALDLHLQYGDDITRLSLITFRQFLQENL